MEPYNRGGDCEDDISDEIWEKWVEEYKKAQVIANDLFHQVYEAGLLDEYMDWGYEKVSK